MRFKMTTKTSSPIIKIKKELPSDEIKDFAETAMNELLGWYGYDNVERVDMSKVASKLNNNNNNNNNINCNRNNNSSNHKNNSDNGNSDNNNKNMNNNCNSNNSVDDNSNNVNSNQTDEMLSQQRVNCSARYGSGNSNTEFLSRHRSLSPDKNSSRESSNSPHLKVAEPNDYDCAWCRRPIISSVEQFSSQQDGGASYCSESCFAQSRRASFKRAKTCDWCRHVRHAVSYVDFQDGASQLQFCSDKCLNQYKMQIFCKETQAHLDMNPHLKEKGKGSNANLITPELWLKNCRSRSNSPKSDNSHTDSNLTNPMSSSSPPPATVIQISTPKISAVSPTVSAIPMGIQKPLISVAPPSKLMSIPTNLNQSMAKVGSISSRSAVLTSRRRRSGRVMTSQKSGGALNNNSNTNSGASSSNVNPKPCTVINAQDLRVNFAPSSERLISPQGQQTKQPDDYQPFMAQPMPHNMFSIRPPHMMQPPHQPSIPLYQQHRPTMNESPFSPPPIPQLFSHLQNSEPIKLPPFGPLPPPVTILVPYPIIIPLPIPIPIPLPMSHFLPRPPKEVTKVEEPEPIDDEPIVDDEVMDDDQPLDCTKSKETADTNNSPYTLKVSETIVEPNSDNNLLDERDCVPDEQQHHQQRIPKFKIKRFNSKRIITNSESDLVCVDVVDTSKNIIEPLKVEPPPGTNNTTNNNSRNSNENNSDSNVNSSNSSNNSSRPRSSEAVIQQINKESESSRPLRKRKRIIDIETNLKIT